MATNNVVKNVKARTAFKSELAPNWYKSPNFIPLPGELVFWDECKRSGYGWKKATDGKYYSRKMDLAQVTKTTPDSDIWNTTALTSTEPTEGTEKYYLDGTKVRTKEAANYYVDENGYLYTIDATTGKEVYSVTRRLQKKGGNNVPLLQIPVQDIPYIKDSDKHWWIGEEDTGIYAAAPTISANGKWVINGVESNEIAIPIVTINETGEWCVNGASLGNKAMFTIWNSYSSVEELNNSKAEIPINSFVIISISDNPDTPEDETNPENARLYFKDENENLKYIADFSGPQGFKGDPGRGIAEIKLLQDNVVNDQLSSSQYQIKYTDDTTSEFIVYHGKSPEITIQDGYWCIDGEKTETKAESMPGENGITPHIENGNWWIGTTDTGVSAGGIVFTPIINDGTLSWENNGSLPNPESVNLKTLYELTEADRALIITEVVTQLNNQWTGGNF